MDIQFTEEQELLRSSVQRLLRDQYDFEARRKIVASEEGFGRTQWQAFAELGLLAAPFSEDVGGLGGGPLSTMIIMQEFGRQLVVEPFVETPTSPPTLALPLPVTVPVACDPVIVPVFRPTRPPI